MSLINKKFWLFKVCFSKAEFSYKSNGRLLDQLSFCEEGLIPYCIIIGTEEIKNNIVKLRNVETRNEVTICWIHYFG
jgi:histidyl-tRNA synthetase